LRKILIANRGEIAVRIIRTCRDMGIATVAVYSACDRSALHVRLADEAHAIGPDQASESYLRIEKLIDVARQSGAEAVHPGYGFLAENPQFATACSNARLTFIGPTSRVISAMGSKIRAREIARAAGVPVVPGSAEPFTSGFSDSDLIAAAAAIGYPLLVKAVAGGGGKGMRIVRAQQELAGAVAMARSEARSAFGDDQVYFERLLETPRHIEVQLLGDQHGTVVPFVERECSIQRRHQKLVEETPSPAVKPELRAELTNAAAAIGRAVGYTSAGTIEFLLDSSGHYYFLEMNTRLQVEHPITEAVTGLDFVRAQIEIARGTPMEDVIAGMPDGGGADLKVGYRGHAIECRVYAEDPDEGFLPSPGLITHLRPSSGPGIRDDSGAASGWTVPTSYDPLISKVIAWAPDRTGAIARMIRALREYDVRGIRTTIGFCRELMASPGFAAGEFDTTYVEWMLEQRRGEGPSDGGLDELAAIAAALCAHHDMMLQPEPDAIVSSAPAVSPTVADPEKGYGPFLDIRQKKGPYPFSGSESLWARQARLESLRL
jgi:acetyl-CoA carboxylase biotin carboxylase subunit